MASYQDKQLQALHFQEVPDFDNLEVRCTWNGDFRSPVNTRISLEVRCVPHTELQLLNTRPSNVFLIDTYLDRLPIDNRGANSESPGDSPQSPLFGFSPLVVSDAKNKGSLVRHESTSKNSDKSGPRLLLETPSTCRVTLKSSRRDDLFKISDLESTSGSSISTINSNSVCSRRTDYSNLARSRKRSATEADFPDSESEMNESKSRGKESRNILLITPTKQTISGVKGHQSTKTSQLTTPQGKHSQKPSLIPKPTPRSEKTVREDPSETGAIKEEEPFLDATSIAETQSSSLVEDPDVGRMITGSIPSQPVNSISQTSSHFQDQLVNFKVDTTSSKTDSSSSRQITSSGVSLHSPSEPGSGEPERTPTPPEKQTNAEESEPRIELVEGILVIKCPANVHSGSHKIIVTADIFLEESFNGWHDLLVAGLPKFRGIRAGFFLFLIPDDNGLEFRTTHLHRYQIVEGCFVAEFSNSGDLVVPIRKCDKNFYGIIRDFTVDQEVRAHTAIESPIRDDKLHTGSKILVDYHAICSLKLHKRCFAADKCCFFLYLDGGPEGNFRCELESESASLPMIYVAANVDATVGVSRIQVICSPQSLESFCVRWKLRIPGNQALYWLPRIYSALSSSRERTRDQLRLSLTEKEGDVFYDSSQEPKVDSEVRLEDSDDTIRSCEEVTIKEGDFEILSQFLPLSWPPSKQQLLTPKTKSISQVKQIVHQYPDYNTQNLLRRVLAGILCLVLLSSGAAMIVLRNKAFINQSCCDLDEVPTILPVHEPVEEPVMWPEDLGLWCRFSRQFFGTDFGHFCEGNTTKNNLSTGMDLEKSGLARDTQHWGEPSDKEEEKADFQIAESPESESGAFCFLSVRDRIDYWLGWRGPAMIEA